MSKKNGGSNLERYNHFKKLYDNAIKKYKIEEYKSSYCSFDSVANGYRFENEELAYDAKYYLALHFLIGLGITKNLDKAQNLFKEVFTSSSKYKERAKQKLLDFIKYAG
ncbi:13337_t:CDS:1 [Dentiscutata erythropus]|uniref:13337_t:CDS:1 n=1 Tax=Dentiscutata erythropus TaxID=1348616 RepID=A0A9N9K1X8_9GLOM|nr:13337_t:CDS:1 [Dentiscutata erythropus]